MLNALFNKRGRLVEEGISESRVCVAPKGDDNNNTPNLALQLYSYLHLSEYTHNKTS